MSQLKQYFIYKIQTFLKEYQNIEALQFLVEELLFIHLWGLVIRALESVTRTLGLIIQFLTNNFLRHFVVKNHEELIFELPWAQIYRDTKRSC